MRYSKKMNFYIKKHFNEFFSLAWSIYILVGFCVRIKNSIYSALSFNILDVAVLILSSPWEMYFLSIAGMIFVANTITSIKSHSSIRAFSRIILKTVLFYSVFSIESFILANYMFDVVKTNGLSAFICSIIEKKDLAYSSGIVFGNVDALTKSAWVKVYLRSVALRVTYDSAILWIMYSVACIFGGSTGVCSGFSVHIIGYNILMWFGVLNSNHSFFLRSLLLFQTADKSTFYQPNILTSFMLFAFIYVVFGIFLRIGLRIKGSVPSRRI